MKLGILIPLKARQVSRNWDLTCACLKHTLESVERQTSSDWEAIVVGQDKPAFLNSDTFKTRFSTIDIQSPTPPPDGYRKVDWDWIRARARDRNTKIVRAMQLLRDEDIDYWYYMDGDDLVHREFVEKLTSMDLKMGAILDGGYLWYPTSRRIIPHSDMSMMCGSTAIFHSSAFQVPDSLAADQIVKVPYCDYTHMSMWRYLDKHHGGNYVRIPERLLAYSVGHGDNTSDGFRDTLVKRLKAWAKPYVLGRKIDLATATSFSLMSRE